MTVTDVEAHFLSLRAYCRRVIIPAAVCVIAVLYMLKFGTKSEAILHHQAALVGFFGAYFVLVRGGHILMIRSLHKELKTKFKSAYEARLARLDLTVLRRRNLGFTLARMKREFIDEQMRQRKKFTAQR